jgi:PPOX class probable F420-dependent enzyme
VTAPGAESTVPVPASHLDLLLGRVHGVLTTVAPDGQPRSSVVWVDHDGSCACVNTSLERHKGRHMTLNPKVSLLVVDPADTGRYIQIRGDVKLVTDGALEHLDVLTRRYTDHPQYYGYVFPVEEQTRETRVICRINARRISLDAIHA